MEKTSTSSANKVAPYSIISSQESGSTGHSGGYSGVVERLWEVISEVPDVYESLVYFDHSIIVPSSGSGQPLLEAEAAYAVPEKATKASSAYVSGRSLYGDYVRDISTAIGCLEEIADLVDRASKESDFYVYDNFLMLATAKIGSLFEERGMSQGYAMCVAALGNALAQRPDEPWSRTQYFVLNKSIHELMDNPFMSPMQAGVWGSNLRKYGFEIFALHTFDGQ